MRLRERPRSKRLGGGVPGSRQTFDRGAEILHEHESEAASLRDRLSKLSEASLRINESLDLETVLQGVLDSARSLTNARYGVITTLDESGGLVEFLTSGLTAAEGKSLWTIPQALRVFEYLSRLPQTLRVQDFSDHMRSMGFTDFHLPVQVHSFICTPMHNRDVRVGIFYLAEKEMGPGFTPEDEEILVTFASQASLVIANSRKYQDEQRARNDLETLVDTSPVGVMVFHAKTGSVVSINQEARRIVSDLHEPGSPAEDLLNLISVQRADGREVALDQLSMAEALSFGETVRAEEVVIRVPRGPSVKILVNATPIRSAQGAIETYVVTMQDMKPLEELERLRAEFLAMVSHELRAPLTSIKGSVDILLEALSDLDIAEIEQLHRLIRDQTENMRELIGNLLDVAHIETGTLRVALEPVEVAILLDQARNTFLRVESRHDLVVDLPPDLPLVMADKRRVVQVLVNLLTNAARYSHKPTPIRLAAKWEGLYVAFSVTDEGRGVSAADLPRMFQKFIQLNDAEQKLAKGSAGAGMGLAICRGIVESHGGRIWAESEGLGRGAKFTFTIPAMEESLSALDHRSAGTMSSDGAKELILAIDDDPEDLRYARNELAKAGYRPIVASNAEEALRLVDAEKPDLVLLDLMLSGADGIELMQRILGIADIPVIFLSAYGRHEVIAQAFDLGAADYVTKPFSPTELIARVKAALRRWSWPEQVGPLEPFVSGDLTVNYAERRVTRAGQPVHMTTTEYRILFELSTNPGAVLTREKLLERVWGLQNSGDIRLVRSAVTRLRAKLGDDASNPKYIRTERGIGYCMV